MPPAIDPPLPPIPIPFALTLPTLCLLLILPGFFLSLILTWVVIRISNHLGALDTPPMPGQIKMPSRHVPNTAGVALTLAFCLPIVFALIVAHSAPGVLHRLGMSPDLVGGVRAHTPSAIWLLAGVLGIHILGLIDDRRPLGPILKLVVILAISAGVILATDTRLLELLDAHAGGIWLSVLVSVLWFGVVTNAMNFMDNMDAVAGGASAIASACLLGAMILGEHWLVAGAIALLCGAILAFLVFNRPPARIYMGDGGSLVVGFLLAFLTTRATYYDPDAASPAAGVHAVLMPLLILAIPLYDFTSVTLVRISQGKSPFKGDLQHFSHRLVRRGLSVPQTAALIAALCAATGLAGVVLPFLPAWGAIVLASQTLILLGILALLERGSAKRPQSSIGPLSPGDTPDA